MGEGGGGSLVGTKGNSIFYTTGKGPVQKDQPLGSHPWLVPFLAGPNNQACSGDFSNGSDGYPVSQRTDMNKSCLFVLYD